MDIPQGKRGKLIGAIQCIAGEVTPIREEYKMCCELSKCMHSADCIIGIKHSLKLLLSFWSQFLIAKRLQLHFFLFNTIKAKNTHRRESVSLL